MKRGVNTRIRIPENDPEIFRSARVTEPDTEIHASARDIASLGHDVSWWAGSDIHGAGDRAVVLADDPRAPDRISASVATDVITLRVNRGSAREIAADIDPAFISAGFRRLAGSKDE
jgi:hypothetical protein